MLIFFYVFFDRACAWSWVIQSTCVSHKQQALCSSLHFVKDTQRDWHNAKLYLLKKKKKDLQHSSNLFIERSEQITVSLEAIHKIDFQGR